MNKFGTDFWLRYYLGGCLILTSEISKLSHNFKAKLGMKQVFYECVCYVSHKASERLYGKIKRHFF